MGFNTTTFNDDNLHQELTVIHSAADGWRTKGAAELLTVAHRRFTGLARQEGADPGDAMTAAWEVWRDRRILAVAQPWSYTATAVRRTLRTAAAAERKLTSTQGLRREGADTFASSTDDALEALPAPPVNQTQPLTYQMAALNSAIALILEHRHSPLVAEATIESMLSAASVATSPARALDTVTRINDVPAAFGLTQGEWNALAALLLGSARGGAGTLEAELTGTENVKHVRNTLARYHRAAKADA